MKSLINHIPAFLLAFLFISTLLSGFYIRYISNKKTDEFRRNLRCGDMVKLRTFSGKYVKARILRRNSDISFNAIDIDNRNNYLTTVQNLFRP